MSLEDIACFMKAHKDTLLILLVMIVYVSLVCIGITNSSFADTDASRHALDGLYYHDLVVSILSGEMGISFSNIYNFTTEQFLRYPAMGLLWWPPFFPFVEALFYMLFGVSIVSAKLCIIFFGILGIVFWYFLVIEIFKKYKLKHSLAFFSSLLFAIAPFIFRYSRTIMREVPATSLCIVASFFFIKWIREKGNKGDNNIVLTALFWAFAVLTKSETIFLGIVFLIYLLYNK